MNHLCYVYHVWCFIHVMSFMCDDVWYYVHHVWWCIHVNMMWSWSMHHLHAMTSCIRHQWSLDSLLIDITFITIVCLDALNTYSLIKLYDSITIFFILFLCFFYTFFMFFYTFFMFFYQNFIKFYRFWATFYRFWATFYRFWATFYRLGGPNPESDPPLQRGPNLKEIPH